MRVIAGEWRGRPIVSPPGDATRPTADRTREALFSMLFSRMGSLAGLRVADLYAGSGALGIEALSRGADHVTFVDRNQAAIRTIKGNLDTLGASDRGDIRMTSALTLPFAAPFDLVLADPPYADEAEAVLAAIDQSGWLAPNGWLSIETARRRVVTAPGGWMVNAEREIGGARLTLLTR